MGIISKFFEALLDPKAATWSAGVSFNRSNPLPLDKWSVFQSMEKAVEYAETNAVAYPGQVIAVYNNGKMVAYVLSEVATDEENSKLALEPIGVIPTGEGAIEVTEEGVISIGIDGVSLEVIDGALTLKGYKDAEDGAQLVKSKDGGLIWVKPDATTVEGLVGAVETLEAELDKTNQAIDDANAAIDKLKETLNPTDEDGNPVEGGLVSDVKELENVIGEEAVYNENGELVSEATGIFKDIEDIEDKIGDPANSELNQEATGLYAALELKADKATTYTKTEVDTLIEQKVVAADHLRRVIVDDINSIDKNADDALLYVYMAPSGLQEDDNKYYEYIVLELEDGERVIEKVGSWEVDLKDYAKNETLANYATNVALGELADTVASNKTELADAIQAEEDRAKTAEKKNADDISDILGALEEVDAALELLSDGKANKDEVYTKDEVYNKDEVYDKSQTDAAIVKAVKDATGGESASAVLADLNAYKKAVNAEVWGNGELLDEELTSSVSRIDTLEENFANIADAEKNFIADVTEDFTVNQARVLSLNDIAMSKVTGLDDAMEAIQIQVKSLDQLINGYEDEDGNAVVGLIEHLGVNYVKVADFNALIADVEKLQEDNVDMKADISELQDLLTWKEMPVIEE